MQSVGLVRKLLAISSLLMIVACGTTDNVVMEDGETYLDHKQTFFFIPIKYERTRITLTEEEYNQRLERQQKEHEEKLRQEKEDHDALMERQKEEQKAKEQRWCTYIVMGCIGVGVVCLFLGYITKQVAWFAGLSGLSLAVAAGIAVYADFLHWIHSVSGYAVIALVAGGTLYLCRKFSLVEWVKVNILNEKPKPTDLSHKEPTDETTKETR